MSGRPNPPALRKSSLFPWSESSPCTSLSPGDGLTRTTADVVFRVKASSMTRPSLAPCGHSSEISAEDGDTLRCSMR